jgi:malate dehydrogenase (oxaloacetate-decarboxylating)
MTVAQHQSASFAFTARCRLLDRPGTLGRLTSEIGRLGGNMGAIDIVRVEGRDVIRDITINAASAEHIEELVAGIRALPDVELLEYSDRVFLAHLGGKISVVSKMSIKTRDDLSMVYTPGVGRVCMAIAEDPTRVRNLTVKRNMVAIVSDGSAVLGFGNIGPQASIPVLEGKAQLFKEFGGVDAFPIALDTQDVDEIVDTIVNIAPIFGGINLEDISAPRCFEVEARLQEKLDIPIFHDDQHGTAVVVVAALLNALRLTKRKIEDVRIVQLGIGAAGTAIAKLLVVAGAKDIVGVDRAGAINSSMTDLSPAHQWFADVANTRNVSGSLQDALRGADIFIGTSGPGLLTEADVELMNDQPIVFALANPTPEINPLTVAERCAVVATGRSDYPNQINNHLCFPGFFRGLLDSGATKITDDMKLAAAHAIANIVLDEELHREYIVPSAFNRDVAPAVASAVNESAMK